jgi:hypothetical protein
MEKLPQHGLRIPYNAADMGRDCVQGNPEAGLSSIEPVQTIERELFDGDRVREEIRNT